MDDTPDFTAAPGDVCLWRCAPNGPRRAAGLMETRIAVVIAASYDSRTVIVRLQDGTLKRYKAKAAQLDRYDGPEPSWAAAAREMPVGRKGPGAKMAEPTRAAAVSDPDLSHLSEGRRRAAQFVERLKWGCAEVGGEDEPDVGD